MIAFHNPLVGNNEGRYEMTEAIVEIEYLMASILDGMDSKPRPRPCELPPVSWTSKLKSREWEAFRVCESGVEA